MLFILNDEHSKFSTFRTFVTAVIDRHYTSEVCLFGPLPLLCQSRYIARLTFMSFTYVINPLRFSPFVFAYCKQSKTGWGEVLRMRLTVFVRTTYSNIFIPLLFLNSSVIPDLTNNLVSPFPTLSHLSSQYGNHWATSPTTGCSGCWYWY